MWSCKLGDKRESSVSVSVGVRGGEEKSGGVFLREGKETSRRWKVCTWEGIHGNTACSVLNYR